MEEALAEPSQGSKLMAIEGREGEVIVINYAVTGELLCFRIALHSRLGE